MYDEIVADKKRVTQPIAVELASRFQAPVALRTSRPKALQRVLERHDTLVDQMRAADTIASRRRA